MVQVLPRTVAELMAKQNDCLALRETHAKEALMDVVRLIRDVVFMVPAAFITGALGGPIFVAGTVFVGARLIVDINPSLWISTAIISAGFGAMTAALSVIPRVQHGVESIGHHVSWVLDPQGCQADEYQSNARWIAYGVGGTATTALAAVGAWAACHGKLGSMLEGRLHELLDHKISQ